jgi:replicative DNA helicase
LLTDFEADATAAYEVRVNGTPRGPMTGLQGLDRELGGALSPGVHIAHGGPGVGKTAFCLQIAATCGFPALFVTCEMASLELLRRHTARETGTFLGRLKSGELVPADAVALARKAAAAAPLLTFADATRVAAAPAWLRQAAEVARGESPHFLIVIDSTHSWAEGVAADAPEYEAINAAIATLRGLASALDCPILAVAERNRASMNTGGLSAAASSRKFEYSAESVWDLSREKDTPPDAAGEVLVNLTLAKNRNGAAGRKLALKFHGALQRFREG